MTVLIAPCQLPADPVLLDLLGEEDRPAPHRPIDGRWLPVRILAQTEQGTVLEVLDLDAVPAMGPDPARLPRAVMKALRPRAAGRPAAVARLRHERTILRRLGDLSGIVRYRGTNTVNGALALRVSRAPGRPLSQVLRATGPTAPVLPVWSRPILLGLAETLERLHARGVVHGDIKPGNVMVAADGTPTLLDFGAARITAGEDPTPQPAMPHVAVTPVWASVPQMKGHPPSEADDVYALALLAVRLLTGRHAFDGRPPRDALAAGRRARSVRGAGHSLRALLDLLLNTPHPRPDIPASVLVETLRTARM